MCTFTFIAEEIRQQNDTGDSPVGERLLSLLDRKTFPKQFMHDLTVKLQELEIAKIPGFMEAPVIYRTDYRPEMHGDDEDDDEEGDGEGE